MPYPRCGPAILNFHDVADQEAFARTIDQCAERHTFVGVDELLERRSSGKLDRGLLALTFDDGFRSVLDAVLPVLEPRGLPFTVFLCTEAVTTGRAPWFVRLEAQRGCLPAAGLADAFGLDPRHVPDWPRLLASIKRMPLEQVLERLDRVEELHGAPRTAPSFLDARQARELVAHPLVTLCPHTHRHPVLSTLSREDQQHEIAKSTELLRELTGRGPRIFAYPNGRPWAFDRNTVGILEKLGYRAAMTTTQRRLRSSDPWWALPRIGLEPGQGIRKLAAKRWLPWYVLDSGRERRIARRSRVGFYPVSPQAARR